MQSSIIFNIVKLFFFFFYYISCCCVADTLREIDTCKKAYKEKVAQMNQEEREKQLKKIEDLFQKAKEYTDNKVQIAVQIYEMVS